MKDDGDGGAGHCAYSHAQQRGETRQGEVTVGVIRESSWGRRLELGLKDRQNLDSEREGPSGREAWLD